MTIKLVVAAVILYTLAVGLAARMWLLFLQADTEHRPTHIGEYDHQLRRRTKCGEYNTSHGRERCKGCKAKLKIQILSSFWIVTLPAYLVWRMLHNTWKLLTAIGLLFAPIELKIHLDGKDE